MTPSENRFPLFGIMLKKMARLGGRAGGLGWVFERAFPRPGKWRSDDAGPPPVDSGVTFARRPAIERRRQMPVGQIHRLSRGAPR